METDAHGINKIIEKTRKDIISKYNECYTYLREHLADIILTDAINNNIITKIKLDDAVTQVLNKLLPPTNVLLQRVMNIANALNKVEDWNEKQVLKNSRDDDDMETITLVRDPLLVTEASILRIESQAPGTIIWVDTEAIVTKPSPVKKASSIKLSSNNVRDIQKVTQDDVLKAAADHRKQKQNAMLLNQFLKIIIFIFVSFAIFMFKNSSTTSSRSSSKVTTNRDTNSIKQSISDTIGNINYVGKFSKSVMNSISSTNSKSRRVNYGNNDDTQIVAKISETIHHIKEALSLPFSILNGMKKALNKLVDSLADNFQKLLNFKKNKA